MSFLSGLFLIALPLAAAPVAIHLYRGRQRDVLPWGAMQFLEQAMTRGRSWQRLEELLLMALRVAALVALVLALSRPLVSSSWWGDAVEGDVVLVVDNSLSMARIVDGTASAERLQKHVGDVLEQLTGSETVHVMLAAGGGQWLTAEPILADAAGRERIGSLIAGVQPTEGRSNLLNCLQAIVHLSAEEAPLSRRVVVFTDRQVTSWEPLDEPAWKAWSAILSDASFPQSVEVVFCDEEAASAHNLGVAAIEPSVKTVRPGERVEYRAEVANYGDTDSEPGSLEWHIDGELVERAAVDAIPAGESVQVATTLRHEERGEVLVTCQLTDDDDVSLDQQNRVVIEVADQVPVLLVQAESGYAAEKPAEEFLTVAMGYDRNAPLDWHSVYKPVILESHELPEANLAAYRAIVVPQLVELSPAVVGKLREYVEGGGGLWIALGEGIERDQFNREWYDDGDGLSPLPVARLHEEDMTNDAAGWVHPPSQGHVATAQLANTTQLDMDEARVYAYWKFDVPEVAIGERHALLESADGEPLVVEQYVGRGRVLVQSFPLGLEWSNLPQLKSYVVMVQDWLDYLTAPTAARLNISPGNAIEWPLPDGLSSAQARMVPPGGETHEPAIVETDGGAVVRYWQTGLPGTYTLHLENSEEDSTTIPFHVARDAAESQLDSLSAEDLDMLSSVGKLRFADAAPQSAVASERAPVRREPVWRGLLVALVVLVIGEMMLSSWLARDIGGTSPAPSGFGN